MKHNLIKYLRLNKKRKIITIAIIAFLILTVTTVCILVHQAKHGYTLSKLATSDEANSLEIQNTNQISDTERDSFSISNAPTYFPNNTNVDKSAENISVTVDPESATDDEHLEFYNEFDDYNSSWDYFKGFILSEVRIDGELFYQLLNKDKDVKIIVDKTQKNAVIYHDGKSMNYYMDFLITETSTNTEIELCDITGDGDEELIISHIYTGTGFLDTACDVINLSTMTEYKLENYLDELSSRITVEPIEINDKNDLICRVTDVNGKIRYGTVHLLEPAKLSDFSYDASEYNYIGINSKDKCLTVSNGICLDVECLYYLGFINSELLFNPKTNCFELSDSFDLSINDVNNDDLNNSNTDVNVTIEPNASITPEVYVTPEASITPSTGDGKVLINENDEDCILQLGLTRNEVKSRLAEANIAITNEYEGQDDDYKPDGLWVIYTEDVELDFDIDNKLSKIFVNNNINTTKGLKIGDSLEDMHTLYGQEDSYYKGWDMYIYDMGSYNFGIIYNLGDSDNKVDAWTIFLK